MIGKGNTHSGGVKLAKYLLEPGQGERTELLDMRGLGVHGDPIEGFREQAGLAEQTKAEKPFFHVQMRGAAGELQKLTRAQILEIVDGCDRVLSRAMTRQPRMASLHIDEKTGDFHIHVAYSLVTRADDGHYFVQRLGKYENKLQVYAQEVELKYGLQILSNEPQPGARRADRNELKESRRLGTDAKEAEAASASDAKQPDLDARRKAVEDAAATSGGLWVSYLFVLFYLLISAGAVTHRDLFFEHPVKMPFLNIELPLKGFFWLGPAIFLVVHAYILLHFVVLSGKIDAYNEELRQMLPGDEDKKARLGLRRLLPTNIIVQFLAGPEDVRSGAIGWLLRAIAWISLVIGPVALLVFIQLQFLPYHDAAITWWQRVAVLLDVVLLWVLWPKVDRGHLRSDGTRRTTGRWLRPGATFVSSLKQRIAVLLDSVPLGVPWKVDRGRPTGVGGRRTNGRWLRFVPAFLASLVPIALVFGVATFPGEWLDGVMPKPRIVPRIDQAGNLVWRSAYHVLLVGSLNPVTSKPSSPWSNRLVLMGLDGIDRNKFDTDDKIKGARETISLRGRDLTGAVLDRADLRKADLTRAQLEDASLEGAQLQDAILDHADLSSASFRLAQLQRVSLMGANLRGAMLDRADLRGASFSFVQLKEVSLVKAHLDGVSLVSADLEGADLQGAHLEGVSLKGANLRGVMLDDADLRGATLDGAYLQGLTLRGIHLQGAVLDDADLRRADLTRADLEGVSLKRANLQGVTLDYADLRGAMLYRADLRLASLKNTHLQGALLSRAQLQGVSLEKADLQGASLSWAQLLGASLDGANLQGTRLAKTQLQGASLKRAHLEDASFFGTFVWRTCTGNDDKEPCSGKGITTDGMFIKGIDTGTRWPCPDEEAKKVVSKDGLCEWSEDAFKALQKSIEDTFKALQKWSIEDAKTLQRHIKRVWIEPEGERRDEENLKRIESRRDEALNRIKALSPKPRDTDQNIAKLWDDLENDSGLKAKEAVYKARAKAWLDAGCDARGAPYVVTSQAKWLDIGNPFPEEGSPHIAELAAVFLDDKCAGARGISEKTRATLLKLVGTAPLSQSPHYNLGSIFSDQGEADTAIAESRAAITIDSEFADMHYNIGVVLRDRATANVSESMRNAMLTSQGLCP